MVPYRSGHVGLGTIRTTFATLLSDMRAYHHSIPLRHSEPLRPFA